MRNRSRREQARRVREGLERQGLQVLPEIVNVQVSTRRVELLVKTSEAMTTSLYRIRPL